MPAACAQRAGRTRVGDGALGAAKLHDEPRLPMSSDDDGIWVRLRPVRLLSAIYVHVHRLKAK
jgi:hypothetical protein